MEPKSEGSQGGYPSMHAEGYEGYIPLGFEYFTYW